MRGVQWGFWEANPRRWPKDSRKDAPKDEPKDAPEGERGEAAFGVIVGSALILMVVLAALVSRGSGDDGGTNEQTSVVAAASTSKPLSDVAELAPTTALISGAAGVSAVAAGDAIGGVDDVGQPLVTLSSLALPDDGLPTPQAAARNLWDAWRDNDTQRGLLYARAKVVNQLFQTPWSPRIRQAGCTIVEAGWLCRFEGARDRWDLAITGDSEVGYRVQLISMGKAVGDLEPPGTLPIASTIFIPPPTRKDGSPIGPYGPPIPSSTMPFPSSLNDVVPIDGSAGISTTLDPSADPGVASSISAKRKTRPTTTIRRKASTTKPPIEAKPDVEQPQAKPSATPEPTEPEPTAPPEPKAVPAGDGAPKPVPVANPE
jgi:hypothetical protein